MSFILEVVKSRFIATLIDNAIDMLKIRNSVDLSFTMPKRVKTQFRDAISAGMKSFLNSLSKADQIDKEDVKLLEEYLSSEIVSNELSKLLDPGLEFFDEHALARGFVELFRKHGRDSISVEAIAEAWNDFMRAFSFHSRVEPELREFLRASYEAGSFRAITSIHEVLSHIEQAVNVLSRQESSLSDSIDDYKSELDSYKGWASRYNMN